MESDARPSPQPDSAPSRGFSDLAQSIYAGLLLRQPIVGQRELDELCAAHPAEAEELRALHAVQHLLVLAAPPVGPRPPPLVTGFTCLRLLGSGGMGEVWEATEIALQRRVALKLQPLPSGQRLRDVERWHREILAAGRLHHPNVVALHSAGESEGRRFIVQELVADGRTLRDEIEELRRVPQVPAIHERRSAERFARLADALQTAHDAEVVHRDVKPQNILIEPDASPKLADFGLALLSGTSALSETGEFIGTLLYASPEQIASDGSPAGPASDVFSLGATLYECLTLERPFGGDDVSAVMRRILRDDPTDPRAVRPRIPRDLALICLKALEKRLDRRYASAAALRDDLLRYLRNEPILARPPSLLRRSQKWIARHPTASATTGLSLAAFVLILTSYLQSQRRARDLAEANERLITANQQLALARDRARSEADISQEIETFLSSLLETANPNLLGSGNPDLRQLVEKGTQRLGSGELTDVRVRARLLCQLGEFHGPLGNWETARQLLQESVNLWNHLGEEETPQGLAALSGLGNALADLGRNEEAEAILSPLVQRWHQGASIPPNRGLGMLVRLARSLTWSARLEEAEELLQEAEVLMGTLPRHGDDGSLPEHALALVFAENAFLSGQLERCAERLDPVCGALQPLLAAGNRVALDAFNLRGMLLNALGQPADAAQIFEGLVPILIDTLGPAHPRSINARTNLANAWIGLRRFDDAKSLSLENVDLAAEAFGEGSKEAVPSLLNLATVLTVQGELDEAEALLGRTIDLLLDRHGPDHIHTSMARSALAICYFQQGRATEAAKMQDAVLRALPVNFADRKKMEGALEVYRAAAAADL